MFSLRLPFGLGALGAPAPTSQSFSQQLTLFRNSINVGNTEYIVRDLKRGEIIRSNKNLVIIGNVEAAVDVEAKGNVLITQVQNEKLMVLSSCGAGAKIKGRDIFISGAGASAELTARRNIFAGTKIIGEVPLDIADQIRTENSGKRSRYPGDKEWEYQRAGGLGASCIVHARGHLYADSIGSGCEIHVWGKVSARHYGGYGYRHGEFPGWWPDPDAEWTEAKVKLGETTDEPGSTALRLER